MPISQIVTNSIANEAVVTADLANSAVTTVKIADGAITTAKIAAGAVVADDIANGAVTRAKMGYAGAVLQVVQGTTSTQVEASYNSATDLGLSLNITPTSATSRILVIVTPAGCGSRDTSTRWVITLRRNTTNLINFAAYIGLEMLSGAETYPSCAFIDSPNTTSSVSYNLIGRRTGGSADCYFNHSDGTAVSTMVAMEIAA